MTRFSVVHTDGKLVMSGEMEPGQKLMLACLPAPHGLAPSYTAVDLWRAGGGTYITTTSTRFLVEVGTL